MKKLLSAGLVFLAIIVALAGNALAGGRYSVSRERWTQKATVGGKVVVVYDDERITSVSPHPRHGDTFRGKDGKLYRWVTADTADELPRQRQTDPVSDKKSVGTGKSPATKLEKRSARADPPPPEKKSAPRADEKKRRESFTVPCSLSEGGTVSEIVNHYTEDISTKKVLKNNWLTEEEAKTLQVGRVIGLPAENLKKGEDGYDNPLKRIDTLRAEIRKYRVHIETLEKENQKLKEENQELRQVLNKKIGALEDELEKISKAP
ncbi:MAG: hypothetical protein A2288_00420 [Candidatus Moranbacteria bacterium RIFOXYA12_FULL_44_15]|nr:MAG: hypothetical protein A2288_00420 [Candidatus Moranbacteria bacterium RIFOXYA12_FULL_44_15]OGI34760.1 MAG: hypothetical protein A2259_05310 [Candidatus Moranbacteria bacterium RIFOXYA2_FULL_43_15]